MSVKASRIVWRARLSPPTTKFVLLALADFLNEDTGRLDPSLQTIADKVGLSRCQAQRIVRELQKMRLVSKPEERPGERPRYALNLALIESLAQVGADDAGAQVSETGSTGATVIADATGGTGDTGSTDATGSTGAVEGSHGCTEGVAPVHQTHITGATQTIRNHHEPEEEPEEAQVVTSTAPQKGRRASKQKLIQVVAPTELIAAGFDAATADEFIACKAERKAPLTPRAWRDHLSESAKAGWTPMAAAEKVMAKTWKGFEAKYVVNERAPSIQSKHAGFSAKNYREGVAADGSFA